MCRWKGIILYVNTHKVVVSECNCGSCFQLVIGVLNMNTVLNSAKFSNDLDFERQCIRMEANCMFEVRIANSEFFQFLSIAQVFKGVICIAAKSSRFPGKVLDSHIFSLLLAKRSNLNDF